MNQFFQVNWVNGMKITSGHFIDMENHFIDRIQHAMSGCINDLSYGLLPLHSQQSNSPSFVLSFSQNRIKVIHDLLLITPGGHLIHLPADFEASISKPMSEDAFFYLVVSVNPYERSPYGDINDIESPLRYPFAIPAYQFDLLPPNPSSIHYFGENVIPLAKYKGAAFDEDTSYIPPCTSIQSHPGLLELYGIVMNMVSELEKVVPELLKKQNITNRMLLIDLTHFLDQNKAAMDWYIPYQPPVFLIEKINQIVRIIKSSVEIQKIQLKDDMRTLLQEIVACNYNHLDISITIRLIKSFAESYTKLLPKDENVFGV